VIRIKAKGQQECLFWTLSVHVWAERDFHFTIYRCPRSWGHYFGI